MSSTKIVIFKLYLLSFHDLFLSTIGCVWWSIHVSCKHKSYFVSDCWFRYCVIFL